MRSFIATAQTYQPTIPAELHNYIVAKYVEKRKFQREGSEEVSYMYITPRTLLGIIRISQSLAKFHFRNVVTQPDVDQAIRLMDYSIRSLRSIKANGQESNRKKYQEKDSRTD
jgi:DNA replication licensing factor MCM7